MSCQKFTSEDEEYEINVAAEALSDLSRKKRDKDDTSSQETAVVSSQENKKAQNGRSKRKKTGGTDEEKSSKKSRGRKKVSKQKSGKDADKDKNSKTAGDGELTTVSQCSSKLFPSLRGSHHPRLLLPKPTTGTTVINVPLSLLINQTTGLNSTNALMKGQTSSESSSVSNKSSEKKSTKKSGRLHKCPKCDLKTTTRQALWKHKQRKHPPSQEENHQFDSVRCQECDSFSCRSNKALLIHYNQVHSKKLRIQHRQFLSEKEFEDWKKRTERVYGVWFVLSNGLKIYERYTTRYYYCNKSVASKSKSIRDSNESSRLNSKCCAYIIKKQEKESGKVTIEYSLDHVGHATKMGLPVVSEDVSKIIGSSQFSGRNVLSLMDEICHKVSRSENNSSRTFDRYSLQEMTKIDIPETQEEIVTLTKLIDKLQERHDTPVLVFKPKGDVSFDMSSEDFILGVQTPFQRDMMKKHAKELVCVHVSEKNSCLISLLIIDRYGDAVPIGWLVSNKKDPTLFRPFLQGLRTNCGDLETDVYVTNLDSVMYKMWADAFSKPWRKLDCSWHVDELWRESLIVHVTNIEHQLVIYTFLKTLQYEANEITFRKLMQEFLLLLDELSPGFKQYFAEVFLSDDRCFHWAFCFRTGFLANSNKIDGAFHEAVKYVLLASSQNPHVADLLLALLKLSHDEAVANCTKEAKNGKFFQVEQEMKTYHQKVDEIEEDKWVVKEREWVLMSVNEDAIECTVQMVSETCHCQLNCDACHVCIHMYSCTCLDYLLSLAGCEHIHAVHMSSEKDNTPLVQPLSVPTEEVEAAAVYLTDSTTPIPENPTANSDENFEQLRCEALEKLKDVEQCLRVSCDPALLSNAFSHLRDIAQSFAGDTH